MDIVIVSQYLRDIENFEGNNSRFLYLANMLIKDGNEVEIITSDFNHAKKRHFGGVGDIENITITVCHEAGYPKNISLKRVKSHKELAGNIKKYLMTRKVPDVLYVAVPSLSVADVCANYCKKNKTRFIVDVQDLWPEAFKMVVNIPVLSEIGFYPMKKRAERVYSSADEIVSVSKTYTERVLSVNIKCKVGHSVFLGTDLEIFDENVKKNSFDKDGRNFVIGYCGTLGASYDITCVIDALSLLENHNYVFLVMGDGPRKEEFEVYAKNKNVNCEFTGRLSYPEMCGRLFTCDIVVNPITHGAAQSIINKHADYAASGLPVINTQECLEYRSLVEEYNMGFNCNNSDPEDMAKKIQLLMDDPGLRKKMGNNARKCAEKRFDRSNSYQEIVNLVK